MRDSRIEWTDATIPAADDTRCAGPVCVSYGSLAAVKAHATRGSYA